MHPSFASNNCQHMADLFLVQHAMSPFRTLLPYFKASPRYQQLVLVLTYFGMSPRKQYSFIYANHTSHSAVAKPEGSKPKRGG